MLHWHLILAKTNKQNEQNNNKKNETPVTLETSQHLDFHLQLTSLTIHLGLDFFTRLEKDRGAVDGCLNCFYFMIVELSNAVYNMD